MRTANDLTQKALDRSQTTLQATLAKMQGQIDVATEANTISECSLISTQRAFLFVNKFDILSLGSNYRLGFDWSNGRSTPTKFMRVMTDRVLLRGKMPRSFVLHNPAEKGFPMFVGPKADARSPTIDIPAAYFQAAAIHYDHLYIWGWAEYFDVFPSTKKHITEFCDEIIDVRLTPTGQDISTTSCERGNCIDDECKLQ